MYSYSASGTPRTAPPEDYDEAAVLEALRRAAMTTEEKVMENLAKSASSLERDA
jgi:hypothetical protein